MPTEPPINLAVTTAVKDDDELLLAARALASQAVKMATHYLSYGSPQTQLSIIKSLLPAIGRALAESGESEDLAAMRTELQALHQRLLAS